MLDNRAERIIRDHWGPLLRPLPVQDHVAQYTHAMSIGLPVGTERDIEAVHHFVFSSVDWAPDDLGIVCARAFCDEVDYVLMEDGSVVERDGSARTWIASDFECLVRLLYVFDLFFKSDQLYGAYSGLEATRVLASLLDPIDPRASDAGSWWLRFADY